MAAQLIESLASIRARPVPGHLPRAGARADRAQGRRRGGRHRHAGAAGGQGRRPHGRARGLGGGGQGAAAPSDRPSRQRLQRRDGGRRRRGRRRSGSRRSRPDRRRRGRRPSSSSRAQRPAGPEPGEGALSRGRASPRPRSSTTTSASRRRMLPHVAGRASRCGASPTASRASRSSRSAAPVTAPTSWAPCSGPVIATAASTTAASTRCRRWPGPPTWPPSRSTRRWPPGDDIESPACCACSTSTPGRRPTSPSAPGSPSPIRDVLAGIGLDCHAKTSGSKGMQLYVPLNRPHTHDHASPSPTPWPRSSRAPPRRGHVGHGQEGRAGQGLHRLEPEQPAQDHGRRLLAAGPTRPTVSTPVTWDEVSDAADGGSTPPFAAPEVLERVQRLATCSPAPPR